MGGARGSADGRVLRGRRNRDSVVESLLSLIEEGELRPTARVIAARAGISVRSVFQHFADVEAIYEAAGHRYFQKIAPLVEPLDPSLPFDVRLSAFVQRRSEALQALEPVALAAQLREPFSSQLRANRAKVVEVMRDQVRRTFAPELDELRRRDPCRAADALVALTAISSWSNWYHLRMDEDNDPAEATRIIRVVLSLLLSSGISPFSEVTIPG